MKNGLINFRGSKIDAAIEFLWLITIFIIPLCFNPFTLNAFYFVKSLVLTFMVCIIFGLCLAQLIIDPHWVKKISIINTIKRSPLQIVAVVYGIAWIISTVFSIMPYKSLWGNLAGSVGLLPNLSWIIFFIILTFKIKDKEQIIRVIYVLLISSGIVSLVGIMQYMNPHILPWFRFEGRVFSTDGNPLSLSAFLAMILPITLAMIIVAWYRPEGQKHNTLLFSGLIFLFIVQMVCLTLAQYSLTMLLFIIGIFSFFALIGFYLRKNATIALSIVFLIVIVIIAGILLGPMLMDEGHDIGVGNQADTISAAEQVGLPTLSIRVDAWRCAVNVIIKSPEIPFSQDNHHWMRRIFGYGPETFIAVSQAVFPSSLKSNYTFESLVIAQPEQHYLYLGATIGIFGLLVFLGILAIFALIAFKGIIKSNTRETTVIYAAFIASIFQYCIHIAFNASVICPELVFWIVMGLTVALRKIQLDSNNVVGDVSNLPDNNLEKRNDRRVKIWQKLIAVLVLVVFIGLGLFLTASPLAANMKIQNGLMILNKDKHTALALYQDANRIEPKQSYYWNFTGNLAYNMAIRQDNDNERRRMLDISECAYLKAIEHEPELAIWRYRLADIYTYWSENGDRNKYPDAAINYQNADRLFPRNTVILNKWAFMLILGKEYTDAEAKLAEALESDPAWLQTSFFKGLLMAEQGNNAEAGRLLLSQSEKPFKDIRYFVNFCSLVSNYGKAPLVRDSLKTCLMVNGEGGWLGWAYLAISDVYCGSYKEAIEAFKEAAASVDKKNRYLLAGTIQAMFTGNSEFGKAAEEIAIRLVNMTEK